MSRAARDQPQHARYKSSRNVPPSPRAAAGRAKRGTQPRSIVVCSRLGFPQSPRFQPFADEIAKRRRGRRIILLRPHHDQIYRVGKRERTMSGSFTSSRQGTAAVFASGCPAGNAAQSRSRRSSSVGSPSAREAPGPGASTRWRAVLARPFPRRAPGSAPPAPPSRADNGSGTPSRSVREKPASGGRCSRGAARPPRRRRCVARDELRDVEPEGRLEKVQFLRDGLKVAQMPDFHGRESNAATA